MATQLQIRRGTNSQVAAFTGAEGEIVVNTTNDSVHVNDGSTAGGFEMARVDGSNWAITNNITTTANIDVGTVTADDAVIQSDGATVTVSSADHEVALLGRRGSSGVDLDKGFFRLKDTGATKVAIDSAGDSYFNGGNVGIGTSSPSSLGTGITTLELKGNSSSQADRTGGLRFTRYDGTHGMSIYNADGASYIESRSTYPLLITTNGTERTRITSDGSLLVGTTTAHLTSSTFSGYTQFAGGHSIQKRSGGIVAYFDRLTDDGTIMQFRRQGTTVGSIASRAGAVSTIILDPRTNGAGLTGSTNGLIPVNQAGSTADNHVDLGSSSSRFKDLYLSGQTFGGDGAANAPTYAFGNDTNMGMYRAGNNILGFSTSSAEVMRLSSGSLLVGTTGAQYGGKLAVWGSSSYILEVRADSGSTACAIMNQNNGASGTRNMILFRYASAGVGTIQVTSSSTLYNTSSDQRLKSNIVDASSASDDIDAIQVRSFDWKSDGSHQKYGMVAQELQAVAPEAVSAPEDSDEMMGVDYSKLVPMLVKEIQSLRARVNALESE